jgi:tetratricopeptide (TPR) repeat protein
MNRIRLVNELLDADKYEEAVKILEEIRSSKPLGIDALSLLAYAYGHLRQNDLSLQLYQEAISLASSELMNAEATYSEPREVESDPTLIENRQYIKRLKDNAAGILCDMGYDRLSQSDYEAAIEFFARSLEYRPDDEYSLSSLAFCYSKTGKLELAINGYEHAISLAEAAAVSDQISRNNYEDHQKHDNSLVNLYEGYYDVLWQFSKSIKTNKPLLNKAVSAYERTVSIGASNADLSRHVAYIYWSLGRKQDTISSLERAISLQPDMIEAYDNLIYYLGRMGKFQYALRVTEKEDEVCKRLGISFYDTVQNPVMRWLARVLHLG